jgi:hypothetical protein
MTTSNKNTMEYSIFFTGAVVILCAGFFPNLRETLIGLGGVLFVIGMIIYVRNRGMRGFIYSLLVLLLLAVLAFGIYYVPSR